jgi:hypothetical protein
VKGFRDISQKELPEIGEEFQNLNWFFVPESVDLVESHLSSSGAKYEILQSINFKED